MVNIPSDNNENSNKTGFSLANLTEKQKKMLIVGGSVLLVIIIIALVVIFVFKGTGSSKYDEQKNPTPIPAKENITIVDPNSNTRPIAIMINNHATARKYHRGLQKAYIVYEIIVEGGITRMMALYKDVDMTDDLIGSVRSSRHYYLDYAMENDAIYVHHGGSPQAYSAMSKYGINHIDADPTAFTRDYSLNVSSEHTSYTNLKGLSYTIEKKGFRTTYNDNKGLLLNYKKNSIDLSSKEGAIKAENISIPYSYYNNTQYKYDSDKKVYLRSVNGEAHIDYDTKDQYTVKNIITYKVANSTIEGGGKGRQELDNCTNGTGYYISEGYAIPIKWSKKSKEEPTKYTYMDGTELEVNDGNTFIQIQPTGQELTIE